MAVMSERAPAKINLTLDVLGRRPDGFHDLRTLMQSVSLCDKLTLTGRERPGLGVTSNLSFLPTDRRNLVRAAAAAFFARSGLTPPGLHLHLEKHIPVGSGMGGGSADAAAALRLFNRFFQAGLSHSDLETLAARVGSDVPFCVRGGTQLAEGRGERLTSLPPLPDCHIVLCKPSFSLSTATVFSRVTATRILWHPDHDGALRALREGDLRALSQRLFNVLSSSVPHGQREIADICGTLLDAGALGALMSGSGPTVYGLFSDPDTARAVCETLRACYPETFLARPLAAVSDDDAPAVTR
ncbi:MAG: 4-(cytidine 5'-diphospho)-2-C-methyl-D-erythritol kinase [Oscillospiraceae bacterium]|jgi:4-diphosphocytidyl-2-C-methyl-D-erythritol kinase|nr:4-(cytidine 5'-diphospho)-2-C-methyl-D-erythritol kinase [Oscillospiraceae bacterium]